MKGRELQQHRQLVKLLAVQLINDRRNFRSVYGHCMARFSENLRNSLEYLMQKGPALVTVMKGRNQVCPDLVAAALEALDRAILPRNGARAQNLSSLQDDAMQTRVDTESNFGVAHSQEVAGRLQGDRAARQVVAR